MASLDENESERRLQIALRMKAARHLRGHRGGKGATPMPNADVAKLGPLLDEMVSANQLVEVEQMKATMTRTQMRAYVDALSLPPTWFDGLYPSDQGKPVSDPVAAVLQRVTADVLELRRAREAEHEASASRDRRRRAKGGDVS